MQRKTYPSLLDEHAQSVALVLQKSATVQMSSVLNYSVVLKSKLIMRSTRVSTFRSDL